jgi:hypothetical protein
MFFDAAGPYPIVISMTEALSGRSMALLRALKKVLP